MKKLILCLFSLLLTVSCQHQKDIDSAKPPAAQGRDNSPVIEGDVGGWFIQELDGPLAQENVMMLKALLSKTNPDVTMTKVRGVWTQVVAGYNARILADYTKPGTSGVLTAVLFNDLEGNVHIKSLEF